MSFSTARLALAAAAFTLPLAAPAMARSSKPTTVKLPASLLKDPAARLCMPKSVLATSTKEQPDTLCQTQADWAAAGITIVAR